MQYKIKIDEFEGPLDLLLHLIKEANIDIYDISIDVITKQYLDYIHQMEAMDIVVASEYLVMASELMLIKSNSLLPQKQVLVSCDEEEEVSRDNLINRLVEYEKYKSVSHNFKKMELDRKKIYTKAPSKIEDIADRKLVNDTDISIDDLVSAFYKFLERKNKEKPLNTKITNKEYSVKKRKSDIRNYLRINKKAEFRDLFSIYSRSYVVVTFMSILELAREGDITILQAGNFANIYVELISE